MSSPQKIKCRAAILYKEGDPLKLEQITVDAPKPDEVRIKMVAAGACASDGHFTWNDGHKVADLMPPERLLPVVLGHEGAGIVESVGKNIKDIQVGDKVLTSFNAECGSCHTCAHTSSNVCEAVNVSSACLCETAKRLLDGTLLTSFAGLGIFSEYACVNKSQVFKVDASMNLEEACIISCSVCTGYFAAINQAQVKPDSTCAVWGLGGIGLNAILASKHAGAKNIVGVDLNEDKRHIAMEMGCTEFVNASSLGQPVNEYLHEKYGGVDFAFDCIGNQRVVDTALASLAYNGTMALVGLPPPEAVVRYPVLQLLFGRRIVGGLLGNMKTKQAFKQITQMYMDGKLNLARLISHRYDLEHINQAFTTLKEGKCIRSIIVFPK